MIEILPPLGKYKYDTWRILPVKCYIDNSVRLRSCIRNINRCHVVSSAQTLLTGVQPRELLYFGSGALKSWNPMVVETKIEILKGKLKHISPLLRLGASVDAFLRVWTSSVHPLAGYVTIHVSQHAYQTVRLA
jgi:hypothetical protein